MEKHMFVLHTDHQTGTHKEVPNIQTGSQSSDAHRDRWISDLLDTIVNTDAHLHTQSETHILSYPHQELGLDEGVAPIPLPQLQGFDMSWPVQEGP